MKQRVLATVTCAVIAALVGFAVGSDRDPHAEEPDTGLSNTPTIGLTDTEIEWARTMATHHEQAVLLTQNLPDAVDPQVALLARGIELAQMKEIGELRGWLRLSGASQVGISQVGTSSHHQGSMSGMATWEDIEALRAATGADAEIDFLQLMVRHHQGGVDMAVTGARDARSAAVRAVALSMVDSQSGEIDVMVGMLRSRGAELLPYP